MGISIFCNCELRQKVSTASYWMWISLGDEFNHHPGSYSTVMDSREKKSMRAILLLRLCLGRFDLLQHWADPWKGDFAVWYCSDYCDIRHNLALRKALRALQSAQLVAMPRIFLFLIPHRLVPNTN